MSYTWLQVDLKSSSVSPWFMPGVGHSRRKVVRETEKDSHHQPGLSRLPDRQTSCPITVPFLLPVAYQSRHRA